MSQQISPPPLNINAILQAIENQNKIQEDLKPEEIAYQKSMKRLAKFVAWTNFVIINIIGSLINTLLDAFVRFITTKGSTFIIAVCVFTKNDFFNKCFSFLESIKPVFENLYHFIALCTTICVCVFTMLGHKFFIHISREKIEVKNDSQPSQ